jgi:2-oxoglutarate dehydrogenase E2 component (dihydrolipoamide succinyltransferase)
MPPPGDPARLLAMVPAAPAPAAAPRPADGRSRAHPSPSERRALREQSATPPAEPPAPARRAPSSIPPPPPADEEVVPMTPLRRRIAERLVAAQHSAAILTTFNEVDMTNVMALRARFQEGFVARHGIKLGFMSFFVKAAVESLRAFPGLNAEIRGSDIVYKRRYHVGVAVGSGKGLVVPVLRDSDRLSFAGIERTIAELAEKARSGKLAIDDLQGGTFSITNGGIYGSMLSTPLLNLPQTGILGMHNIVKRPVAVGAEVQIRPMMYLALSYDHRVVDGREAVQFLVRIKECVEEPDRILLEI